MKLCAKCRFLDFLKIFLTILQQFVAYYNANTQRLLTLNIVSKMAIFRLNSKGFTYLHIFPYFFFKNGQMIQCKGVNVNFLGKKYANIEVNNLLPSLCSYLGISYSNASRNYASSQRLGVGLRCS